VDARQDAGDVGFGNAAFLGHARQAVADGGQALVQGGLTDIGQLTQSHAWQKPGQCHCPWCLHQSRRFFVLSCRFLLRCFYHNNLTFTSTSINNQPRHHKSGLPAQQAKGRAKTTTGEQACKA
jgi:hypothetical protein